MMGTADLLYSHVPTHPPEPSYLKALFFMLYCLYMLCKLFSKLFGSKCAKQEENVKAEVDQLDSGPDIDLNPVASEVEEKRD